MSTEANLDESIEQLQQLGLKEYEARCFVGLTRLSSGTAKELSAITDVPRTRVYDAIRVLESKGLVEIHHSSPQRFRAVSIEEAIETLRDQYEFRLDRVQQTLSEIEPVETDDQSTIQEVWSIRGASGIESRTKELVAGASEEIVLVVGHESTLTDEFLRILADLPADTDLLLGAVTDSIEARIQAEISSAPTVSSNLEWLTADGENADATIGRILLVDRSTFLVSSLLVESEEEQAICGEGFGNGFIILARRLLAQELV